MTSGFHVHAQSHVSAHTHVHTYVHTCTPLMLTSKDPLKTTFRTPKLPQPPQTWPHSPVCPPASPLPLPSPMHGESPRPASHPMGSPGRINFQLTTGGWPGVSTWTEPRQTGCGTRVDYTCRVGTAGGEGESGARPTVATFTVVSQPTWRSPRWPGPAIQKFML